MIVDALLALHGSITGNTVTGAAITGASSVNSANVIDLSLARDIGEGEDLYGRVVLTAAVSGGTSVEFQFISDSNANLATTPQILGTTGPIAVANLVAGAKFAVKLAPSLFSKGQQYIGMHILNSGATTLGTAYADIGVEVADNKVYQSGFTVL